VKRFILLFILCVFATSCIHNKTTTKIPTAKEAFDYYGKSIVSENDKEKPAKPEKQKCHHREQVMKPLYSASFIEWWETGHKKKRRFSRLDNDRFARDMMKHGEPILHENTGENQTVADDESECLKKKRKFKKQMRRYKENLQAWKINKSKKTVNFAFLIKDPYLENAPFCAVLKSGIDRLYMKYPEYETVRMDVYIEKPTKKNHLAFAIRYRNPKNGKHGDIAIVAPKLPGQKIRMFRSIHPCMETSDWELDECEDI